MTRTLLIMMVGICLGGCASQQELQNRALTTKYLNERAYLPSPATALAFDPPVPTAYTPDLSRDDRAAGAFGGYQGADAEYYDVQTNDDYQFFDYPGTYERQVTSDRVGVIYH